MSGRNIKAYITNTGQLIKVEKSDDSSSGTSAKLQKDLFGELYKSGRCARPPHNPMELVDLLEASTYHFKCIKQKSIDVAGSYSIVETESEKDSEVKAKGKKKTVSDVNRKKIIEFLKNCNPILSFTDIAKACMMDLETVGWFVLEVIRNRKGDIIGLNHIPAHTTRYMLDGTGVIHKRDARERLFKFFGDKAVYIDPNTNLPANEVIYKFEYDPRSDYYGFPDYMPAVGAMLANLEIRDYNIKFFENGAIPQYAVVLEGGELDEETEEVIKSHFRDNLKGSGNAHKTLVISTPEGGKVQFQPLAVDVKDGHFRLYRIDNRDEIIQAHGVPPYRIGIAETGSLGGNVAEEMTEIYKNSVIKPRQRVLEEVLQKIFADEGFFGGVEDWKIEFDEIDTSDEKLQAEIDEIKARTAKTMKEAGTFTPDEIRQVAGQDPYSEMDDVEEDIKEWASKPIDYQDPSEAQQGGFDEQGNPIDPNANLNDSEGNPSDSEGTGTDPYQSILQDYRSQINKSIVQKAFEEVKKVFQVDSERVWERKRKKSKKA